MKDQITTAYAQQWLASADELDHAGTWQSASTLFQSAIDLEDWRKSLKAARSPLGPLKSRSLEVMNKLDRPDGAPDGNYKMVVFSSAFENRVSAQECLTLIEESGGLWRTAGYFIK